VRRCSSWTGGLAAAFRASDAAGTDFVDVELFARTAQPKRPDHQDGAVTTSVREALATFDIAQDQLAFSTLVSEWTTPARLGSARDEGIYLGEVRAT
jgi:hypothetical protein